MTKDPRFTTVLLLLLLVGAVGVHRFYVGKYGTGIIIIIVSLFTMGIGGIIWVIIDLILLLNNRFTDNEGIVISPP